MSIALGELLSPRRFYWAVIAAFITFMGANNSGEQVRKALFRVACTVVGIGVGSLLVTAVGHHTYWSIAVILASLFLGFYLMRINYAFMVVGITVMISQLYVQLNEFSNSLLLLRLEETALGAGVAIAVVMLVLPLRTRRVLRIAVRDHVQAVARLAGHATDHLLGRDHGTETTLRSDARAVDAAYQALTATAQPLRRNLFGTMEEDASRTVRLASAARNYSRNLVADTERAGLADACTRLDIELASATLRESLDVVADALTGSRDATYTRSAALFDRAERRLEQRSSTVGPDQLAIRDLKLIDGTMAGAAGYLGLRIADYDTQPAGSGGIQVRGRVHGAGGAGVGLAVLTLIDPRGRQVARAAAGPDGDTGSTRPRPGATSCSPPQDRTGRRVHGQRPGMRRLGSREGPPRRPVTRSCPAEVLTKAGARPVPGARVPLSTPRARPCGRPSPTTPAGTPTTASQAESTPRSPAVPRQPPAPCASPTQRARLRATTSRPPTPTGQRRHAAHRHHASPPTPCRPAASQPQPQP